jgi:valyl-tRNA synthetase
MGYDDSGLPTERRVQRYFGVRCDPSLPYDADFKLPLQVRDGISRDPVAVDRRNFSELCARLTHEDEDRFELLFRRLGLSVDWQQTYSTIGSESRAASQRVFITELEHGAAYQVQSAGLWDVTFQTGLAQAEVVHRDFEYERYRLAFSSAKGPVRLETSRPELLVSAVALVVNPGDDRYRDLVGTKVRSPLFDVELPVISHSDIDPDRGTGVTVCCTFGDLTDVRCWEEFRLPTRQVLERDGVFSLETPSWLTTDRGRKAYAELAGKTVQKAREAMVAALRANADLVGVPELVRGKAKFYEQGEVPLEVFPCRQWYVTNGWRDADLRSSLLRRGRELSFYPPYMQVRYENWVNGLSDDWLISRQRSYGVPMPIWYPLNDLGDPLYERPLVPSVADLPIDPASDVPPGYTESQRDKPGGFVGESYVLDVWATTSVTPQIVGGWISHPDLYEKVYPFDLRPQGQDIIRTWLFGTMLRAHRQTGALPWRAAAISGWVLDPQGEKMSKSRGNAVPPLELFEQFGSDAVRYWAASKPLGADANLAVAVIQNGRRLALKVLNVSRFVLGLEGDPEDITTEPLDMAMISRWAEVVDEATEALEGYEHDRALRSIETEFRLFCDTYVEMVKQRARLTGQQAGSARATLRTVLDVALRLLAPFLPFVTEEVWSWQRKNSVHRAQWPEAASLRASLATPGDVQLLARARVVLAGVRRAKVEANVPLNDEVTCAVISAPANTLPWLSAMLDDLRAAGKVGVLELREGSREMLTYEILLDAELRTKR